MQAARLCTEDLECIPAKTTDFSEAISQSGCQRSVDEFRIQNMIGDELRVQSAQVKNLNDRWEWAVDARETVRVEDNHIRSERNQVDIIAGFLKIILSVEWKENDDKMVADFYEQQQYV